MTFQVRRRDEVELQSRGSSSQSFDDEDPEKHRKLWYHRLPLLGEHMSSEELNVSTPGYPLKGPSVLTT